MTSAEGMINKGGPGACFPRKFSKFKHFRMQSDAIWMLKFGKHQDFIVANIRKKKLKTFSTLAKKLIKLAKFFCTKLSIVDQFVLAFNMFPLAQTNVGSFINQL